jgi:hypothetical protein
MQIRAGLILDRDPIDRQKVPTLGNRRGLSNQNATLQTAGRPPNFLWGHDSILPLGRPRGWRSRNNPGYQDFQESRSDGPRGACRGAARRSRGLRRDFVSDHRACRADLTTVPVSWGSCRGSGPAGSGWPMPRCTTLGEGGEGPCCVCSGCRRRRQGRALPRRDRPAMGRLLGGSARAGDKRSGVWWADAVGMQRRRLPPVGWCWVRPHAVRGRAQGETGRRAATRRPGRLFRRALPL